MFTVTMQDDWGDKVTTDDFETWAEAARAIARCPNDSYRYILNDNGTALFGVSPTGHPYVNHNLPFLLREAD